MVTSISSSYDTVVNDALFSSAPQADEVFGMLSKKLGADGTSITRDQVESYINNAQAGVTKNSDNKALDYLNKLLARWNKISGGKETITRQDLQSGYNYLQFQVKGLNPNQSNAGGLIAYGSSNGADDDNAFEYGKGNSTLSNSFDSLVVAVGAVGGKITKEQLIGYLRQLTSRTGDSKSPDSSQEIALVKNLIAQFDTLSGGADYITSLNGINDAQDYKTVTVDQVTPPIDLKI